MSVCQKFSFLACLEVAEIFFCGVGWGGRLQVATMCNLIPSCLEFSLFELGLGLDKMFFMGEVSLHKVIIYSRGLRCLGVFFYNMFNVFETKIAQHSIFYVT